MRIISGIHKGRRLQAPKSLPVRPTTDMAKEGLMNILSNRYDFNELRVLDLFSGTGNISFEFASRGVVSITAVDGNHKCVGFIDKISRELDLGITTNKIDVYKFLGQVNEKFDLIFADPPYNFEKEQLQQLHRLVFDNELLDIDGSLILEHEVQKKLSDLDYFQEERKYGSSVFSFFSNI